MRTRLSVACSLLLVAAACGSGATSRTSNSPTTATPAQRAAISAAYEASRTAGVHWATMTKACLAKARSGRFATPGEAVHCIATAYTGSHIERRLGRLKAKLAASAATLADGTCRTATVRWITTFPGFLQALRLVHAHDADLDQLSSADAKLLSQLAHPFTAARHRYLRSC